MKRHSRSVPTRLRSRGGFTLLEVLIATAVTLLMMVSLAQIFKVIGDSMKQGRAALELNNQLRSVANRIRNDLDNLTVIPDPPANPLTGTGYLKIFDGSTTDNTHLLQPPLIAAAISRFGDIDDILMGTIRAGDVWFTGKVPRYILTGTDPVVAADFAFVTIASQHAEVIAFLQPLVTNVGNPSRDPSHFLTASPNGAVAFQDTDIAAGFPDGFRLHYRRLLIRPDLNLSSSLAISSLGVTAPAGVLPAARAMNAQGQPVNWTVAQPQTGLPEPLCDMSAAHQQCDLSVRRVFGSGPAAFDFIAANSLEDLLDPANRFAHIQVPIPGNPALSTMPLLALGPRLPIHTSDPTGTLTTMPNAPFEVGSGFLHPAYALYGSRAGEDLLASSILAFDLKGFDPGVPLLPSLGPDGGAGTAMVNDDGVGPTDDVAEIGWAGTDDLVLTPNDPGYATVLGAAPVGAGEYVDFCWAHKLRSAGATVTTATNVWSQLSGYSSTNFTSPANGTFPFTDAFYRSGLILQNASITAQPPLVFQPSFDTWTSTYEGDGIFQVERTGSRGTVSSLPGAGGNPLQAWRRAGTVDIVDAGTDGVDNNSATGIDETAELETSAPFPAKLRGLKVSIRMEDPATRQVKQMSVAKEFVSQ